MNAHLHVHTGSLHPSSTKDGVGESLLVAGGKPSPTGSNRSSTASSGSGGYQVMKSSSPFPPRSFGFKVNDFCRDILLTELTQKTINLSITKFLHILYQNLQKKLVRNVNLYDVGMFNIFCLNNMIKKNIC